ncbi:citrate/2-methylcitrate synthase [Brevundimonas denitrificans]|uniref:citrate/2-methylcitrate synthase n=1 Tax=Brevundimonas denitrificans TaxID=1443434 RepID=UPI00223B6CE7|nr:citrate/2-methylcitrate synthase [Brevundimonas denitrificans]
MEAGERATGLKPSFDLALALIVRRFNLPRDGAFDLFAIGRSAGLLAHALDQFAGGGAHPRTPALCGRRAGRALTGAGTI